MTQDENRRELEVWGSTLGGGTVGQEGMASRGDCKRAHEVSDGLDCGCEKKRSQTNFCVLNNFTLSLTYTYTEDKICTFSNTHRTWNNYVLSHMKTLVN